MEGTDEGAILVNDADTVSIAIGSQAQVKVFIPDLGAQHAQCIQVWGR